LVFDFGKKEMCSVGTVQYFHDIETAKKEGMGAMMNDE